jgi:hypothetical protein
MIFPRRIVTTNQNAKKIKQQYTEGRKYPLTNEMRYLEKHQNILVFRNNPLCYRRVCLKVPGLAAWSENYKWYSSMPLDAVAVSLFSESV